MNNQEAADLLYSVCEYPGLSPEMLKHQVLSGWVLRPPSRIQDPLGENSPYPPHYTVEIELGETKPRLMTEPWGMKL